MKLCSKNWWKEQSFIFWLHDKSPFLNIHCVKSIQMWSFSGGYFPIFTLNIEIYGVNLRIQSEYEKVRTRKNSLFGYFSPSDMYSLICNNGMYIEFNWLCKPMRKVRSSQASLLTNFWTESSKTQFSPWILLIKAKRNQKWKIPHTLLERWAFWFSSCKDGELNVNLWWVRARER